MSNISTGICLIHEQRVTRLGSTRRKSRSVWSASGLPALLMTDKPANATKQRKRP
jgi:hypothetical protein